MAHVRESRPDFDLFHGPVLKIFQVIPFSTKNTRFRAKRQKIENFRRFVLESEAIVAVDIPHVPDRVDVVFPSDTVLF